MARKRGARPAGRRFSKRAVAVAGAVASALVAAVLSVAVPDVWHRLSCGLGMTTCFDVSIDLETDFDRFGGVNDLSLGSYLFAPGAFSEVPPPPSCGDGYRFQEWALAHGGRPHGMQQLKISVTTKDEPVLIDYAEVVTTPLEYAPGDVAACVSGGQLDVRTLDVDLDSRSATYYADPMRPDRPGPMALHIAPGEAEVFVVTAGVSDVDVEWRVNLGMIIDGARVQRSIDDHGKPFFLAANRLDGRTFYTESQPGAWEESPY